MNSGLYKAANNSTLLEIQSAEVDIWSERD